MFRKLIIVGLLTVALAACGQSGPLYLPQDVPADSNQEADPQSDPQVSWKKGAVNASKNAQVAKAPLDNTAEYQLSEAKE